MLDVILSELFDAAVDGAYRFIVRPALVPRGVRSSRQPSALQERSLRADYRAWAKRLGMTAIDESRRYRGRLARYPVTVNVGIDVGSAVGIDLAMEIPHPIEPGTLAADSEGRTVIEKGLVALCRAPARAAHLRSIAVLREGLRFRFAPLTLPDVVESCALDAAAVIELATTTNAYR